MFSFILYVVAAAYVIFMFAATAVGIDGAHSRNYAERQQSETASGMAFLMWGALIVGGIIWLFAKT